MTNDSDHPIEDQLRDGLRAVAATAVLDREPPPLAAGHGRDVVPVQLRARRPARALAAAACVSVLAGVGAVAWAARSTEGDAQQVSAAGAGTSSTTEDAGRTGGPEPLVDASDAPNGAQLLAVLAGQPDQSYELWAVVNTDGSDCWVAAATVGDVRSMVASACELPPWCADDAWSTFFSQPDGSQLPSCPPSGVPVDEGLLDEAHGSSMAMADGTSLDEPVLVIAKVSPRVATWEVQRADGTSFSGAPVVTPDPDSNQLFLRVPGGREGLEITMRDDAGNVLATKEMYRDGQPNG